MAPFHTVPAAVSRRMAVLVLAGGLCLAAPAAPSAGQTAETAPEAGTYRGRRIADVMSYQGAEWLERDSREQEERTSLLLELLPVTEGQVIVDLGCGSGYFARRLAGLVKETGRVLCVDVQPEMLQIARGLARDLGISNIDYVLATEDDPRLPEGSVDLILLVDVYHELQHPEPVLRHMHSALSEQGRVALVEYRSEGTSARHIKPEHRMSVEQVLEEWEPMGFALVDLIEELPTQHLFLFGRAASSQPAP